MRVLNLCVLFSNPVGLNLLRSFKMWPFSNPPHNFSFHFTFPEPPHFISPAHSSSLCSVVFLWMEKRKQSRAQGRCTASSGKGADGSDLTMFHCFPPAIRGRRADSTQMSTSELSRRATHFPLLYTATSSVGVVCLILPPSFCISPGTLHGFICQPSCNSSLRTLFPLT